ncbi:hypothetical protein [Thermovibrio sp.]
MKKLKLAALLTVAALFAPSASKGGSIEELLKKPESYWQELYKDYLNYCAYAVRREDSEEEPKGIERLLTYTSVVGSYQVSARELLNLYDSALRKAQEDALRNLNCKIDDPDLGFLIGNLTWQTKLKCYGKVEEFIKERTGKYLKEAILECNLLKLSPLIESFLKSSSCNTFKEEFAKEVVRELFKNLKKCEISMYKEPQRVNLPRLKRFLVKMKEEGLI